MLRCYKCGKRINLGFDEKEDQDFADEIKLSKVVLVCIGCYEETQEAIERLALLR